MPLWDEDGSDVQARFHQRRDHFAALAAERAQGLEGCQFSLLPYKELEQNFQRWYEACAEGMARANWGPLEDWIRVQGEMAADHGFELQDFLQLLRFLRTLAGGEGWHEDELAEVDALTREGFAALRGHVPWDIPEGLDYQTGKGRDQSGQEGKEAPAEEGDRRAKVRNRLRLPIRVRGYLASGPVDETTETANVSRTGIYFVSTKAYYPGAQVSVVYPYWDQPGALNIEYRAEVTRIDKMEGERGVALRFLSDLRAHP